MRFGIRTTFAIAFAALAAWLTFSIPEPGRAQAPAGAKGGKGKGGGFAQDPRAETRMYHFEDTNEDLPYSIYVSSKVKKNKKAPLIVTLHGLGAPQTIMMSKTAVDLAEEGGYILVAPMGYNTAAGTVRRAWAEARQGQGQRCSRRRPRRCSRCRQGARMALRAQPRGRAVLVASAGAISRRTSGNSAKRT